MAQQNTPGSQLKSVDRAFRIVELLREEGGLTLTEVAEELDMAKSSTHRYLKALEENGYVVRDDDNYYPGLKFLTIGQFARERKKAFRLAKPKVKQIAEKTDERAELIVEEHGRGIFVHHETGENAVTTDTGVGTTLPLHATAAGKAILAYYPDDKVQEIINRHGLSAHTNHTITDKEELFAELETIRENSIAFNRGEIISGVHAVGVPLRTDSHTIIGALSITGPSDRLKGDRMTREIPELLRGVAKELELNLAYS